MVKLQVVFLRSGSSKTYNVQFHSHLSLLTFGMYPKHIFCVNVSINHATPDPSKYGVKYSTLGTIMERKWGTL